MKNSQPLRSGICLGLALFAGVGYVSAQGPATETDSARQSVLLTTGEKRKIDFNVRALGSVKGRVFNDGRQVDTSGTASEGIGGVKLTLLSREAGFENFVLEQYSEQDGTYTFKDLRPGKYTLEIDPGNLPKAFRPAGVNVEPLGVERSLTGIVFIDNDGDGRYKKGSDALVHGALVTAGGNVVLSDAEGRYTLRDLPAGRLGLLVTEPQRSESTHIVLDIHPGPVTNRVVNVPITRQR